jgi:riboflavin biosynthesis pyrimidine reductase
MEVEVVKRPLIILNIFASIDGRLTTAPNRNVAEWTQLGLDGGANDVSHRLFDELECDGLISGSESLIVWGNHYVPLDTEVYWPKKSKAYIVFDGRGRLNFVQTEGLLVVTRSNVHPEYIHQLREKNIQYITAGDGDQIDLPIALQKLYESGFRRLGLTGGGKINGAFLRQNLIDEFSIVVAPVAVGGTNTPTIFDSNDANSVSDLTALELIQSRVINDNLIWMHYKKKGSIN